MSKYRFAGHLSATAAQMLGEHFERLAQKEELTPEAIVKDARRESSPIHEFFEWDDAVAATKYRREQARYYLCNLRIEIAETHEIVKAFHSIRINKPEEPEERSYKHIDLVADNTAWLRQIIERAQRELVTWRGRYRQYSSMATGLEAVLEGPLQEAIEGLDDLVQEAAAEPV